MTDQQLSQLDKPYEHPCSWASLWSQRRPIAMLFTIVIAVFGTSISFDFVNWDDPWYVLNNTLISSWSFSNLYGIATETVTRNYGPITIFSFLVDRSIWGYWPGGYHLTNILLHAVNAILVFVLLKQITQRHTIALFAACLFAIHPVQVESVVWISARKGLLSASFILLSLLYWLREERGSRDELWGTFWFVLALLSKAVGIIVPGIVLVYDLFVRKKTVADALSRQFVGILLAIWLVLTTAGSQQIIGGGIRHHFALNKLEMLSVDAVLLWKYIAQLLWPAQLSVMYDPPIYGITMVIVVSITAWGFSGYYIWNNRDRIPLITFAFACFFAPLVPVLNLFPITTIMNDRYLYLACIPFFAALIAVLQKGLESGLALVLARTANGKQSIKQEQTIKNSELWAHKILLAGLSIAIIVGSIQTSSYITVWRNDYALWEHAVKQTPELPVVQYQYALAQWRTGEHHDAIKTLEYAIALDRVDEYDLSRFDKKLQHFREQVNQKAIANSASATPIKPAEPEA
ncbi:MAG: hypothetical protein JKY95_00485 [Planctomycetaceae bacterium]|nr:hypothetical protein [Planctomycetaceae bacterium]